MGRLERWTLCSQTYREYFFWAFIVLFNFFCSVSLTLWTSLNLRFTGVPRLSVVKNVVKNASLPDPAIIHRSREGSVLRFWLVGL